MKTKAKSITFGIVTMIIAFAAPIVSNACGITFGEEPVPEMLRK